MTSPSAEPGELTYQALVAEARSLLPALDPGWTDHNPSDPGIALIELFAWLTEMLAFQVDEVPAAATWSFLALLNGPGWRPPTDPGPAELGAAVASGLQELERRHRAVTTEDYEHLLRVEWPAAAEAADLTNPGVARVRAVPRRDLTRPPAQAGAEVPAHVSVVVVPPATGADRHPSAPADLLAAVTAFLEPRRLVTTRLHVVGPVYADVGIGARLGLRPDAPPEAALEQAVAALRGAFDPFTGGPRGQGRDFGRGVYLSEVYAVLDALPMVDFAEEVTLTGARPVIAEDDSVSAIDLAPHELAVLSRIELVAHDGYGRPHPLSWTPPVPGSAPGGGPA